MRDAHRSTPRRVPICNTPPLHWPVFRWGRMRERMREHRPVHRRGTCQGRTLLHRHPPCCRLPRHPPCCRLPRQHQVSCCRPLPLHAPQRADHERQECQPQERQAAPHLALVCQPPAPAMRLRPRAAPRSHQLLRAPRRLEPRPGWRRCRTGGAPAGRPEGAACAHARLAQAGACTKQGAQRGSGSAPSRCCLSPPATPPLAPPSPPPWNHRASQLFWPTRVCTPGLGRIGLFHPCSASKRAQHSSMRCAAARLHEQAGPWARSCCSRARR